LHRKFHVKHVIEGKIDGKKEVTRRQEGRHKLVLGDFKEKGGYYELEEEALDRTMWRIRFGSINDTTARQISKLMI
jgi:hypothetical protein